MDQHLDFVTLGVRDLPASRRFYVEGLGWKPLFDLPEIVFFQIGHGIVLGLFGADDLEHDAGSTDAATDGPGRFALANNVGSRAAVDAAVERFVAAGGTVLKPPQKADFGGYHAYVADPDGFRWEICHNSGFSVDADGTPRIGPVTD